MRPMFLPDVENKAVCLFNFYNRWIDASGVHEMSDEGHRQAGVRIAQRGYSL